MPRRERGISRSVDEQLHHGIQVTRTDAVHRILQDHITQDQAQQQSQQDLGTCGPFLPAEQKDDNTQGDPDVSLVPQMGNGRHQHIHPGRMAVLSDPVQNPQFRHGQTFHRAAPLSSNQ